MKTKRLIQIKLNLKLLEEFFIKDQKYLLRFYDKDNLLHQYPMSNYNIIKNLLNKYNILNDQIVINFITILSHLFIMKDLNDLTEPTLMNFRNKVTRIKSQLEILAQHKCGRKQIIEVQFFEKKRKFPSKLTDQIIIDLLITSFWAYVIILGDKNKAKIPDESFLIERYKEMGLSDEECYLLIIQKFLEKSLILNVLVNRKSRKGRRERGLSMVKKEFKRSVVAYFNSDAEINCLKHGDQVYIGANLFVLGGLIKNKSEYKKMLDQKTSKNPLYIPSYKNYRDYLNIQWNRL